MGYRKLPWVCQRLPKVTEECWLAGIAGVKPAQKIHGVESPADFNALHFPGRKVLYLNEVAERLKVGEQTVRDLIEEGKLHAIDVGGGSHESEPASLPRQLA